MAVKRVQAELESKGPKRFGEFPKDARDAIGACAPALKAELLALKERLEASGASEKKAKKAVRDLLKRAAREE
ncbi:MAG: hypothetical protein Kow0069_08490 [Promethearchaeota archaeon]